MRVENTRWNNDAQAAACAARVMATTLPPEIEQLTVVFHDKGVPISRVVTQRSDLEELQFDYARYRLLLQNRDYRHAFAGGFQPMAQNLQPSRIGLIPTTHQIVLLPNCCFCGWLCR